MVMNLKEAFSFSLIVISFLLLPEILFGFSFYPLVLITSLIILGVIMGSVIKGVNKKYAKSLGKLVIFVFVLNGFAITFFIFSFVLGTRLTAGLLLIGCLFLGSFNLTKPCF